MKGIKGEGSETNGYKSGKHAPRALAYTFSSFNEKLDDLDLFFFYLFEKQCEALVYQRETDKATYTAYFQENIGTPWSIWMQVQHTLR